MMFRSTRLVSLGAPLLLVLAVSDHPAVVQAQDDAGLRDIQIGMQGLAEAGKDPAVLAQLMKDMQDPELMAEAQKMMQNPEWKKKMKEMTGNKEFKESIKKTKEMLSDPNAAAQAEAKLEHMQRVGNDRLKEGAASQMEQAMAAMANPETMAEMTKMLKDPKFKQQLEQMAKDPQFANYMEAMQDMMKDPKKKKHLENVANAVKSQL